MRTLVIAGSLVIAACDYGAAFRDCTIACSGTCPSGLECQSGLCRPPGATGTCSPTPGDAPQPGDAPPHDTLPGDAAQGAIAFDAMSDATVTNAATMTWQHTVGTGSDRLLVVAVSIEKSGAAVSGVTFDASSMKSAAVSVGGANTRAELWYLAAPQPGTHPVVVSFSPAVGSDGAVAGALSLTGVDQAMPVASTVTGGGTSTSPSTTLSTEYDDAWVIDVVMFDSSQKALDVGTGQVQLWKTETNPGNNGILGAGSVRPTTSHGPYTMSWTPTSVDNWAQAVAEIRP